MKKNKRALLIPAIFGFLTILLACLSYFYYFSTEQVFGDGENRVSRSFQEKNPNGRVLIQEAVKEFERRRTIDAIIRLKVNVFGEEYTGNGFYLEKKSGRSYYSDQNHRLFLMEMKYQPNSLSSPGTESSTLKVVCTGKEVWKYSNIEDNKQLQRIDLEKLDEHFANSGKTNEWGDAGRLPYLGGLEGTLLQVDQFYSLGDARIEESMLGTPEFSVWKISASLKKEKMEPMFEAASQLKKKKRKVQFGDHLPLGITVYLGKEDLFPYRIEYYSGTNEGADWNNPIIKQDFLKVAINGLGDVANTRFEYFPPPGVIVDDTATEVYAKKLGILK